MPLGVQQHCTAQSSGLDGATGRWRRWRGADGTRRQGTKGVRGTCPLSNVCTASPSLQSPSPRPQWEPQLGRRGPQGGGVRWRGVRLGQIQGSVRWPMPARPTGDSRCWRRYHLDDGTCYESILTCSMQCSLRCAATPLTKRVPRLSVLPLLGPPRRQTAESGNHGEGRFFPFSGVWFWVRFC